MSIENLLSKLVSLPQTSLNARRIVARRFVTQSRGGRSEIVTARANYCAMCDGAFLSRDANIRRCRISRAKNGANGHRCGTLEDRDRQTLQPSSFRRLAEAMDRRADIRLDQPKPPSRTRLRTLRGNRRRLCSPRHDPHHAQTLDKAKPLITIPFFLHRL